MKKITLLIVLLLSLNLILKSATITLKYGSTPITSTSVYIFQNGRLISSQYTNSSGVATFTLSAGNYSYKTATNFIGDITATSTVTLDHKKLTFTIKNNLTNPVNSERIQIYEDGTEVDYDYTNSSGILEFYLKPSDKYAYKTSFNQAAFSLQNDVSLNLTKDNVKIIAKYLNYPIADNFTLYPYNDRSTSFATAYSSTTNGEVNFNLTTGKYLLKNKLNIYTELNITNTNQQILLDYKKVRFISNVTAPNILENVVVSNGTYSTDTKITDGKGYADFYLLPATYTYSHLGMSESFTVTNDTTINLTTQIVTFNLRNGTTSTAYANQPFKIGKDINSLSSYITNSSGTCQVNLKAGSYIFSDGLSSYPFTITGSGQTIIPPLYDVTFNITQNLSGAILDYIYVTSINTGKSLTYNPYTEGMKVCLLQGDYNYYCYSANGRFSASHKIPFTVTQNSTLQGMYTFQLNLTDGNSVPVSNQSFYIKQNGNYINTSFTTDNLGQATAYLPNGNYQLYNIKTQEENPFSINNQNQTLIIQFPNEITLNVTKEGQPLSGSIVIYNEQKTSMQMVQVNNGTCKARLTTNNNYYFSLISTGVSSIYSKAKVSSTSLTLDFVAVQIKTQGKGLAFPYQMDEDSKFYALNGSVIRLAAVPMKGWKCEKWTINSTDAINDMVDYTLTSSIIATAIFIEDPSSAVPEYRSAQSNNLSIYPNPAQNQITFSENVNGTARIYNNAGILSKELYVIGSGLNVSDLTSGLYILSIESEGVNWQGKFIKE